MSFNQVSERKGIPTFSTIVEVRDRKTWIIHDTVKSVDRIHRGEDAPVQVRTRQDSNCVVILSVENKLIYHKCKQVVCISYVGLNRLHTDKHVFSFTSTRFAH